MFVEPVYARRGGEMSPEDLARDADLDTLPLDANALEGDEPTMDEYAAFCRERDEMYAQSLQESGEPMEPSAELLAVRYWFLVQDPACNLMRGIQNLRMCNDAYTSSDAGGRAARAARMSLQEASKSKRNAERRKGAAGKRKKKDDDSENENDEPEEARAAREELGRAEQREASATVLAADVFARAPTAWEGHRTFGTHRAFLNLLHAYNPRAAMNALSANEDSVLVYTNTLPRIPKNPSNVYEALSPWYAFKGVGDGALFRATCAAQRYLSRYFTVDPAQDNLGLPAEVVVRFPCPNDTFELEFPRCKQACVFGCAFPWVKPTIRDLAFDALTFAERQDAVHTKMLHMEAELRRQMGDSAVDTASGTALSFEDFCRKLRHSLGELPTPRARRLQRLEQNTLETAWNMLCQSADPHVRSVMEYLYERDRTAKADGGFGYSLFCDEVGERLKDPLLEPLANFVLKMMDDVEHVHGAISHHAAVWKVYVSALGVFQPSRTMKYNVGLYGPPGTSKSFVMRIVVDHMMCGDVAMELTDFSAKPFQNDTNLNYSFIVMDEIHDRIAGINNGKREGEGDAMWKAWLTSQTIKGIRTKKLESGDFVASVVDKEMIGAMCFGSNYGPARLVPALVDRVHMVEITEVEREGHGILNKMQFEMLGASSASGAGGGAPASKAHESDALYRKCFALVMLANMYIKMGLLEEPSMLVATMGIARQLEELKRGGAAAGFAKRRHTARAFVFARTLTILKAVVEVFCNRATCPLSETEWLARSRRTFQPADVMLLQAHMNSNDQVAALTVTSLMNQWVEPMQAYALQQLFEHGNAGNLKYCDWVIKHFAASEGAAENMPSDSKLTWVVPNPSNPADQTRAYMYARFGPIPKTNPEAKTSMMHVAHYVVRLIAQTGGQSMSVNTVHAVLQELHNTKFDAPLYDFSTRLRVQATQLMPVVRLDEKPGALAIEVLESWVRASYSDAHQNAAVRAVTGLGHAHARARPLLTATQIMSRRALKVENEDVLLPQFLEVVSVRPNPAKPWVVASSAPPGSALDGDANDEFDEFEATACTGATLLVDEDAELWELQKYLARCGFSAASAQGEYEQALRAYSLHTVADTMQRAVDECGSRVSRFAGMYPDIYIERFVEQERERRVAVNGAASGSAAHAARGLRGNLLLGGGGGNGAPALGRKRLRPSPPGGGLEFKRPLPQSAPANPPQHTPNFSHGTIFGCAQSLDSRPRTQRATAAGIGQRLHL